MKQLKRATIALLLTLSITLAMPISIPILNNVEYVEATSIKLNKVNATIFVGETLALKLSGTSKTIKWSSNNIEIAKVSSKGIVTAIKKGTTKITAVIGSKKYTCALEVMAPELSAKKIYENSSKATVEIIVETYSADYNLGSGFFIDNGVVVTNYHVIEGASTIKIITNDGTIYTVEQVLGYDKNIDIAILKITSKNKVLIINQESVSVGEMIYTLGSPLGLTGTFTNGMVSSASRIVDNVDYIQITASMSQGNSGGPLLNTYGEVIGINTWQYTNAQNINFAINISELNKVAINNPITVSQFYQLTMETNVSSPDDTVIEDSELKWLIKLVQSMHLAINW